MLNRFVAPHLPSEPILLGFAEMTGAWRSISVALVLSSPTAGVTRYPRPTEPGLSSGGSFRRFPATAQLTCRNIVTHFAPNVNQNALGYGALSVSSSFGAE